jgi:NADPH:quinone reductase and related Zn-dependent oxidoreductases
MRAITIPKFGDSSVLSLRELPAPEPGPLEVTIDVAYAGVNYAEVLFRKGVVPDLPLPFVPGIEVSGTVRAVGDGVTDLRVGQPVAALTIVDGGGYAEVAKAPRALVIPLDEAAVNRLDLAAAAAFPSNATTAYMVMTDVARMRQGETVLVHAAAGGVGSLIGQTARRLGAGLVIGTVGSPAKLKYAKSLGYDYVFLRDQYEAAVMEVTGGQGPDVVVDPVGGKLRREAVRMLKPFGRLVAMGNAGSEDDVSQPINELWFTSKAVLGFNLRQISEVDPDRVAEAARKALRLAADGGIRIDVTDVLELHEASEAHRRIEAGVTTGKLVLSMGR